MSFADASTGWAAGAGGTILATADGGATWRRQPSGVYSDLHGLWFADSRRGWAAGANGALLVTVNGGLTWQSRDTGGDTPFLAMAPAGPNRVWLAGGNGTMQSLATPDLRPVAAAEHMAGMVTALRDAGIGEDAVDAPLRAFGAADADLTERQARIARERAAAAAADDPPRTALSVLLADPMLAIAFNRLGIGIFILFVAVPLARGTRWASRASAHSTACADAAMLSEDAPSVASIQALSPDAARRRGTMA